MVFSTAARRTPRGSAARLCAGWLCAALGAFTPAYGQTAVAPVRDRPNASPATALAPLTLQDARRLAEAASPAIRAAEADATAGEGELRDTWGPLWNNPQLGVDVTRRRSQGPANDTATDGAIGISQAFEIAGQQGYRRRAAELELSAIRSNIDEVRRQVHAEVELRFTRVLALQNRLALERDLLRFMDDAAGAVRKRVDAGEDTRLDGNLAAVEAERARNQLTVIEEQLIQARAELATLLQLAPEQLPEAAGSLDVAPPPFSLDELLARAATRPLLQRLEFREQAAQSRLSLERAARYPDITLGVNVARESQIDGRERVATFSVAVPLPIFRRNAAGVGRALTALTQTQIEKQAAVRDVQAQVRAFWQRLESLRARVARLSGAVIPMLNENRRLSATAYRAGEIGLLQLIVVNRQLLDAQRDQLDAVANFIENRIALEQAAGVIGAATADAARPSRTR